jgi:lysophospholipase L1-like esterase
MKPSLDLIDSFALPQSIDLVVGVESNLYFDALLPCPITEEWEPAISCELGSHRSDRWIRTPKISHLGRHPLTLSLRDPRDGQRRTFATCLHIHEKEIRSDLQRWLPIGDSITASGHYVEALLRRANQERDSLQSVGTRQAEGTSSVKHEGYPGWKYLDFLRKRPAVTGPNFREEIDPPFIFSSPPNEKLDFAAYRETHLAGQDPDFITIFLGANDVALLDDTALTEEIPKIVSHAEALINAILEGTTQSRVGLMPPLPPSASQDAFGINYGCLIPRWRYRKNQHALLRALQDRFGDFSARLSIIPAFLQIDPVTGYPARDEPTNTHAGDNHPVACNSVHPSPSGHRQIADAIFAWMIGQRIRTSNSSDS